MNLHDYFLKIENDYTIILYKGPVSSELLSTLLKTIEQKLEQIGERVVVRKKIFNVMVESIQNLIKHVDEHEINTNNNAVMFSIQHTPEYYLISTGNFVTKDEALQLSTKLDKINLMNKEQLRDYYQEVLENQVISPKGGAGLGLIDIARKSSDKVAYELKSISDELSFFTLKIKVIP